MKWNVAEDILLIYILRIKKILESYGIKEEPSKFFILPKINNFQVIILAFTDSDVEGYYLKVIDKK
ncbi:hypothetical protein HX13_17180 [Chryseobacterium sp. P1-3]|nr:hypothetical protein HX13_17180 [Chryseobacterium sp. P1-3]